MNIKDFTAETLTQVTQAIRENESTFPPHISLTSKHGGLGQSPEGWSTIVEFDIAVTQESTQAGGARLEVVGLGGFGGTKGATHEVVSRVRFKVPLKP